MKKTRNIFWKFFSTIMVTLTGTGVANAADETMTKTLCNENNYVARCREPGKSTENSLGTRWLKGYYKSESSSTGRTYSDAFNYYDSPISMGSTKIDNNENLRKFFGNCPDDNCKMKNSSTKTWQSKSKIAENRNEMLSWFCDPMKVFCEPCPNGGTVPASTVVVKTDSLVAQDWHIHTIADCVVSEFQDTTGTYSYYDDDNATTSTECYYSIERPGTGFRYYYS